MAIKSKKAVPTSAKKKRRVEADIVEDLDLQVAEPDSDDDFVVQNKRATAEVDELGVLPGDAHKADDEIFDRETAEDQTDLALATGRRAKRALEDADYDVPGVGSRDVAAPAVKKMLAVDNAVIEEVERDFSALTSSQRMAMLQKESPEVLQMVTEFKENMAAVRALAEPLRALIFNTKHTGGDAELVSFLETKLQLMLSYCIHVAFYLLLKSEGKKVAGHPVVDRLVEIRVYMEKMWPVEQKLQYSLNKLLSGASSNAPKIQALRPVVSEDGGAFKVNKSKGVADSRRELRRLEQVAADAKELEKEELAGMLRVRAKKAGKKQKESVADSIDKLRGADSGMQDDEDQFLTKMVADYESDEDDGGAADESLIDKLRAKMAKGDKNRKTQRDEEEAMRIAEEAGFGSGDDEDEEDFEFDEDEFGDMLEGEDEEDDEEGENSYSALLKEENERTAAAVDEKANRTSYKEPESSRRKITTRIEKHRGLTKSRPKDKKNPRVNRRAKFEKGQRAAGAQSRSKKTEAADTFSGVAQLKTHVTHSNRLS